MDEEALDTECPVCYETFSDSARTLSCGHTFCHDCMVGTFVGSNRPTTRDSIICPMCRHVTLVSKQPRSEEKNRQLGKILEVPLKSIVRPTSVQRSSGGQFRWARSCLRWFSSRLSRQRLVFPKNPSQVFIISDLGHPIAEDDVMDVGTVTMIGGNSTRRRRGFCSTSHFLVFLLLTFLLLALIAATMPWILLA